MEPILHASFVELSATLAGALFSAIWEGAVLTAAVALCLRLVPRLSAAARSAIWLNVFALLVLLPMFPVFVPSLGQTGSAPVAPVHLDLRWSVGLACAWAVLSLWRGTQLIVSAVSLHRIARRAVPVIPDAAVMDLLQGRRRVELCTSTEVERPSVFGFFRPRILLPPGLLEDLSPAELRQVVLHETEHLRRGDDWSNLLQKLGLVLFPLNPALLWVERRLCAERELACDDRVLLASTERKSYALCLTHLAEYSMLHRGLSLVLGAFERKPELVRRVHRILGRPAKAMSGKAAFLASAGLVTGALGCAVVLARSPQVVSFAPVSQSPILQAYTPVSQTMQKEFVGQPKLVKASRMPYRIADPLARRGVPQVPILGPGIARSRTLQFSARAERRRALQPALEIATQQIAPPIEPIPQQQAFIVLTEWTSAGEPPQLVIAVAHESRPRYAAVPFGNGWLIVQI